jgi:hypothetical protein
MQDDLTESANRLALSVGVGLGAVSIGAGADPVVGILPMLAGVAGPAIDYFDARGQRSAQSGEEVVTDGGTEE